MSKIVSKPNVDRAILEGRLKGIRMSGHERVKAEARMAQAENFADAVADLFRYANRLLNTLVLRPFQRLRASH